MGDYYKILIIIHIFICIICWILAGSTIPLMYDCYPNSPITVRNPDNTTYVNVYVRDIDNDVECNTTWHDVTTKTEVTITDCVLETDILISFTDRDINTDAILGGSELSHHVIYCNGTVNVTGVTANHVLGLTINSQDEVRVTPVFSVVSKIRVTVANSDPVHTATVGQTLKWTIDIPVEYTMLPVTCSASSQPSNVGSSKIIVLNGCSTDISLVDDFSASNINSDVPYLARYFTDLYVFRFVDSNTIYISCELTICSSSAANCDINCSERRRRMVSTSDNSTLTIITQTSLEVREMPLFMSNNGAKNIQNHLLLVASLSKVLLFLRFLCVTLIDIYIE